MPFLSRLTALWLIERVHLFHWAPVMLGIGIGGYFAWDSEPSFALTVTALSVTSGLMLWRRDLILLRAVFLITLGFFLATQSGHWYGTPMLDHPVGPTEISGTITDIEQHGKGQRLLVDDLTIAKLSPENTPHHIHLALRGRMKDHPEPLQPGQKLQALVQLMPLSEPMAPGGFDFRRNGYFQGIGATGYIMSQIQLSPTEDTIVTPTLWFAKLRQNLQTKVKQNLSGDRAGLAIVLLTGDKTFLSPETTEAMRSIGLAHLLAIAGLHIGLVAGIVFFLMRGLFACSETLALRYPIKKWAAFIAMIAITFYMLQVGAPVPTRRALLMSCVVLIGIILDRMSLSLRTVALAAFGILLIWPHLLLHPSFQLSFAAVLALIAVGEWQRKRGWHLFAEREGAFWFVLRHMGELAIASVVATLATLPFGLYQFQEIGIYGAFANTLAIPLTSLVLMPLCVFVDLLWPFGLAEWPLKLLDPALGLLIKISESIATLPGAHYAPPAMPIGLLVLATFGGLIGCLMVTRLRWIGFGIMMMAVVLTFFQPRPNVFISSDGHQIGWHRDGTNELLISSDEKTDKFVAKEWAHLVGVKEDAIILDQNNDDLSCDLMGCIWRGLSRTIAWEKNGLAFMDDCKADHALIINPENNNHCDSPTALMLDRESFYQHGAATIYADGNGLKIRTVRDAPAQRPWSLGWKQ